MDAVAVLMIGVGTWLMYAAYKNASPVTVALHILSPTKTPAPTRTVTGTPAGTTTL